MIKVTLVKSTIGEVQSVKDTIAALGLRKIRSSRVHKDTACIRGMLKKVSHLVTVENVEDVENA